MIRSAPKASVFHLRGFISSEVTVISCVTHKRVAQFKKNCHKGGLFKFTPGNNYDARRNAGYTWNSSSLFYAHHYDVFKNNLRLFFNLCLLVPIISS